MRGLLKKDLLLLRSNFIGLTLFAALYAVLGYFSDDAGMLMGVLAVLVMMMPASSLQYDEYYHWNRYVLTMPVSRKMVVQSKYLLVLMLLCVTFAVGFAFTFLLSGDIEEAVFSTVVMVCMSLFMTAVSIPCMLKWGSNRGRVIIILLCGVFGVFIGVFSAGIVLPMQLEVLPQMPGEAMKESFITGEMLQALFLLGSALATVISYKISCRIYEKKEF